MILVLDNYDSFVHNLARYFRQLGRPTTVVRSDDMTVEQIRDLKPSAIVLSPGPNTPDEAGCCLAVVEAFTGRIPLFGVCLGHQVIVQAMGGRIARADPMHGVASQIHHDGQSVFRGLPNPFNAARYHSLIADADSMPSNLQITAWTHDQENNMMVMAVQHRDWPVVGVQFHPESVLTEDGASLLKNFMLQVDKADQEGT